MVIEEQSEQSHDLERRRPWWFLPALAAIVLGAVIGLITPGSLSFLRQEAGPVSSCEQGKWPAVETPCAAARNTSVTVPARVAGPWTVKIWLTTLEAVDARFHPPRQVSDHPRTRTAPVWLFIYESTATGQRVLHVAPAFDARPGAFIYVNLWDELGSPAIPETMPTI
jgi:hypothetical protein